MILLHLKLTEAECVEGVPENQRSKGKLSGASREPAASKVREWQVGQQTGLENIHERWTRRTSFSFKHVRLREPEPSPQQLSVKHALSSPPHSPLSNMGPKRWQHSQETGQALAAYPAPPHHTRQVWQWAEGG